MVQPDHPEVVSYIAETSQTKKLSQDKQSECDSTEGSSQKIMDGEQEMAKNQINNCDTKLADWHRSSTGGYKEIRSFGSLKRILRNFYFVFFFFFGGFFLLCFCEFFFAVFICWFLLIFIIFFPGLFFFLVIYLVQLSLILGQKY